MPPKVEIKNLLNLINMNLKNKNKLILNLPDSHTGEPCTPVEKHFLKNQQLSESVRVKAMCDQLVSPAATKSRYQSPPLLHSSLQVTPLLHSSLQVSLHSSTLLFK